MKVARLGQQENEHMSNKATAQAFLKMAGGGDVENAYDKFVAPDFIHHNQYFKGDRQSLMAAMMDASKQSPNKTIEVKHVYEDGATIITHSHVKREDPAAPEI